MTEANAALEGEVSRHDCFLCRPNASLLVDVGAAGYAIAGLGPLVDGYTVVATHGHIHGLAAANDRQRSAYSSYAESVASKLAEKYGACFIVEHGNMAVCGIESDGRVHCFHPHFLLIPDARCNLAPFHDYFGHEHPIFESLESAIAYGAGRGQYVLAGRFPGPFTVFLPEGDLPRQFARALLAEQLDVENLASWREMPNINWTSQNAVAIRDAIQT